MKLPVILMLFCLSYFSLTNMSGAVDLEEYGCTGSRTQQESYQEPYVCSYIYRAREYTSIRYQTCYRTLYREGTVPTIKLSNCPSSCGGCSGSIAISSPTCQGQRLVSYQEAYSCKKGWWFIRSSKTCYRTLYKYETSNICCPGSSIVNEISCQRECGQNNYGIGSLSLVTDNVGSTDRFIRGGTEAQFRQFPWQVRLSIKFPRAESGCGGSIISERWILTAAHCLLDSIGGTVFIGDHWMSISEILTEVRIPFTRVILHPSYTASMSNVTANHDIALIPISPITFTPFVRPVCLPANSRDYTNQNVTISGWGQDNSGFQPDVLQYTRAQVVPDSSCDNGGQFANEICALGQGRSTSCFGDSGGPMTYVENGRAYQIGVAWYVRDSCSTTKSFAYTDVGPYLDWIHSTIGL